MERPTERRRGYHPGPKQPLQGHHKAHTADVPMCHPGANRRQDQDPTDYTGTHPVPCGPEWTRTVRQPGNLRSPGSVQSDLRGHCSLCPGGWAWTGSGALPPLPATCAWVPWAQRARRAVSVAVEVISGQQVLVLCPRLRIRETTKEPTPMQTHEGLFTSSSLGPNIPDTAEQGLGPRD